MGADARPKTLALTFGSAVSAHLLEIEARAVIAGFTCGGHPQQTGTYHYHGEPYALTNDDASLVGVLLDGYPVYGRKDADGGAPTLDANGGHTSTTAESPSTPVYHYHLNQQTSTGARTAGEQQWFLTTGAYHGTPGTCTGAGCS